MHRITRYNLLFKRLLSYLESNSSTYAYLISLMPYFANINKQIEHAVQMRDSTYRINDYDYKVDMGNICDVICCSLNI